MYIFSPMNIRTLHKNIAKTAFSLANAVWYSQKSKYICRRAFDLATVAIVSPIAVPIIAVTALSIKLCNGQSPFFSQSRIGYNGQSFQIHKLKTYDDEGNLLKCAQIARRSKLDELPQLWNVVKGEMSLVGPRPHLPDEPISHLPWRLQMMPGITGLGKIGGGNAIGHTEEAVFDRRYKKQCDKAGLGRFITMNAGLVIATPLAIVKQRKNAVSYQDAGHGTELQFGQKNNRRQPKPSVV